MPNNIKYGCVLFDDITQHATGWASVSGEDSFRISSTQNLATDTVWLTNITYDVAQFSGLASHARFRKEDYLRRRLGPLRKDLGLNDSFEACPTLSNVFERSVKLVQKLLHLKNDEIPQGLLRNGIRDKFMGHDPVHEEPIYIALRDATSPWTSCERADPPPEDFTQITFRVPPVEHSKCMLSTMAPTGSWEKVDISLKSNEDIANWLTSLPGLAVINIAAKDFNPEFNQLYNFGSNPAGPRTNRQWVTSLELITLIDVAKIEIYGAYVNTGISPDSGWLKIFETLPSNADLSYSLGLALENIWTGFCSGLIPPAHKRGPERTWINDYAPFIRAMDRMICLQKAIGLQRKGFDVVGYGVGSILIFRHNHNSDEAIYEAAEELNLLPPTLGLTGTEGIISKPKTALQALRALMGIGKINDINKADEFIFKTILEKS